MEPLNLSNFACSWQMPVVVPHSTLKSSKILLSVPVDLPSYVSYAADKNQLYLGV